MRTLFIGEDGSLHVNSFLWANNVDTGSSRESFRFLRARKAQDCKCSTT